MCKVVSKHVLKAFGVYYRLVLLIGGFPGNGNKVSVLNSTLNISFQYIQCNTVAINALLISIACNNDLFLIQVDMTAAAIYGS